MLISRKYEAGPDLKQSVDPSNDFKDLVHENSTTWKEYDGSAWNTIVDENAMDDYDVYTGGLVGVTVNESYDSGYSNNTHMLKFSSESLSLLSLKVIRTGYSSSGLNSSLDGYIAGNTIIGGLVSTIEKFNFWNLNTESTYYISVASQEIGYGYGFSSSTHGYSVGGFNPSASNQISTVFRNEFSNDLDSMNAYSSINAYTRNLGGSNSTVAGYVYAGYSGHNSVYKYDFSVDTSSTLSTTLEGTQYSANGVDSSVAGYRIGARYQNTTATISGIVKVNFSDDSITLGVDYLSAPVTTNAGSVNSSNRGYAIGGNKLDGATWAKVSSTQIFEFSSDSALGLMGDTLATPMIALGIDSTWRY